MASKKNITPQKKQKREMKIKKEMLLMKKIIPQGKERLAVKKNLLQKYEKKIQNIYNEYN